MKIAIHYYSGAGNTKFVAKQLAKRLKQKKHIVIDQKISEKNLQPATEDFDMLGVGFPIYFREAPELVYDFLTQLNGKQRLIFFFATKGLYSGNAIRHIMQIVEKQEFKTIGTLELLMPGTDSLLLFAKENSLTEDLLKRIHSKDIQGKIERFATHLEAQRPEKLPRPKWYTQIDNSIVKKLENQYDNHHRTYIGQFYSDHETCIECMKCVQGCPRENIVFNEKIEFSDHCDVCFNCVHNCLTQSIQIGTLTQGNARYNRIDLR